MFELSAMDIDWTITQYNALGLKAPVIRDHLEKMLASFTPTLADNSVTTSKILNNAVTNAKLADMSANTVKVRSSSTSGDPVDLLIGEGKMLGRLPGGNLGAIDIPSSSSPITFETLSEIDVTNGGTISEWASNTQYVYTTTTTISNTSAVIIVRPNAALQARIKAATSGISMLATMTSSGNIEVLVRGLAYTGSLTNSMKLMVHVLD
jgi:hypothetical protein